MEIYNTLTEIHPNRLINQTVFHEPVLKQAFLLLQRLTAIWIWINITSTVLSETYHTFNSRFLNPVEVRAWIIIHTP